MVLLSGLLVGTLDILSAFADFFIATGKNPVVVLKFITSGICGKAAMTGGVCTAAFGLLLHYIIAFTFTVFFWYFFFPRWKHLSTGWIVTGLVYGIFIWCIMNLIVVPLSNTPPITRTLPKMLKACLILIFMIGLPLSFIAHGYFKQRGSQDNR